MKYFKNTMLCVLTFFVLFVSVARAEDDDDDILGEMTTDLAIGVFMGICSSFAMCHLFMVTLGFISFVMVIIGICSGEIGCDEIFNCRNVRRGATIGIGRRITQNWR
jgi:hypothetical protein